MATTILRKSTIPQSFKFRVEEKMPVFTHKVTGEQIAVEIGLNPDPIFHTNSSVDIFGALFKACAEAMSTNIFKNKDKSALVFQKEDNGEIIAAVVSEYDAEGDNYFYSITFDPSEVKSIKNVINFTDFKDEVRNLTFIQVVNSNYSISHNIAISDDEVLKILIITALECIYYWLDQNAKDGEVIELVIDDIIGRFEKLSEEEYNSSLTPVAIAMVETVKDIKKMSIQFSEELKPLIDSLQSE